MYLMRIQLTGIRILNSPPEDLPLGSRDSIRLQLHSNCHSALVAKLYLMDASSVGDERWKVSSLYHSSISLWSDLSSSEFGIADHIVVKVEVKKRDGQVNWLVLLLNPVLVAQGDHFW